jgi:hypothetical protein
MMENINATRNRISGPEGQAAGVAKKTASALSFDGSAQHAIEASTTKGRYSRLVT